MPKITSKSELEELLIWFGFEDVLCKNPLISDDDKLLLLAMLKMHRYSSTRVCNGMFKFNRWWETALLDPNYDPNSFRTHFRMSREVFWELHMLLMSGSPEFTQDQEPVYLQLAVALYRFGTYGNSSAIPHVAAKFGVSEGSVVNYTDRAIKSITKLSSNWIRWPGQAERQEIGNQMAAHLFPKCVGFVDGTDIPFAAAPLDNKEVYWSRKKKYSMQLQVICDHTKSIRDIFVGYPGSVHDAKVFSLCPLGVFPDKYFGPGEFLIGDSAYALTDTMIVPYRRTVQGLSSAHKRFNLHLSSQRVAVEHTIGMLKGRFQSLTELRIRVSLTVGHRRVCDWIHACAILHNFLNQNDPWDTEHDNEANEELPEEPTTELNSNQKGATKREALLQIHKAIHNL